MTILHIITRLILGGAQQNTVMTCAAQVEAGHDVHLAFGPIYGPEGSLLDEARGSGATLHEVRSLRRAVSPVRDLLAKRALAKLIERVKPDVVHTHSSKAGIVGRAAAWSRRVPAVVHTVHGLPFHERQSALIRNLYVKAERWAARRCHRMIGITQAMCDAFTERGIGRPERFSVVPSGIDVSRFELPDLTRQQAKVEFGLPGDAQVVGMVARFDPLKGHNDLLDIVPALQSTFPGVRVLFVGDGWHRKQVEQRVADEGLTDVVTLTGLLSPDRTARAMHAMDVVVLPSYQEGQSRVLAEVLVAGCAIAAYDVGGIGAICIDGHTGRLVPMGDRQAMRDAVVSLLDDPVATRNMVERGRAHVVERFSHRVMVDGIEAVYRDVLE